MEAETFEAAVRFKFHTGFSMPGLEHLHVRYRPPTPENLQGETIVEQLASLLIDFDLMDGGRRLEPTVEVLEDLPLFALETIAEAILGDYSPTITQYANLEMLYKEPSFSRAQGPVDLWVYETALELGYSPAEVRGWNARDRAWMRIVKGARARAEAEMRRRAGG